MNESITTLRTTGIVDFQVMVFMLAFMTQDVECQDEYIEEVLRTISKSTDEALSKTAENLDLPDSLRNSIFAECMEHVANIKRSTLGIARDLRG